MPLPADDGGHTNRYDSLSSETIHEFGASLTVISAHAQMVRRWLQRNDVAEAAAAATRLTTIDAMVKQLCVRLNDLDEPPAHDDAGPSRNGQHEP